MIKPKMLGQSLKDEKRTVREKEKIRKWYKG